MRACRFLYERRRRRKRWRWRWQRRSHIITITMRDVKHQLHNRLIEWPTIVMSNRIEFASILSVSSSFVLARWIGFALPLLNASATFNMLNDQIKLYSSVSIHINCLPLRTFLESALKQTKIVNWKRRILEFRFGCLSHYSHAIVCITYLNRVYNEFFPSSSSSSIVSTATLFLRTHDECMRYDRSYTDTSIRSSLHV